MDFDSDASFVNQKPSTNYVKFYRHYVEKFKEHRDYILIICPGQAKTEVRRPIQDIDKINYSNEWRAYIEGKENQINGTALEMMGVDQGMIDALKSHYVFTVEQLANLSDLSLQKIMGGNELRKKAQAFLEKNTTEVVELRAKLAELQAKLEQQSDLQNTVAILQAQVAQFANRKKPGPKPKGKNVAINDNSERV